MLSEGNFRISETSYEWTSRALALLEKVLKVNIRLHHGKGELEDGDIFVFNHFARFETFIPQYLIYRETGALCRSVAAAEFFRGGDAFSRYLLGLGAVPNDHEGLLPFLVAEVLRGRKVIVFPEGGMVKDRRVLDRAGRYSVYSRTSHERRKHHTGAAVVAIAADGFKAAVREAERAGDRDRLGAWARRLGLSGTAELVGMARRPTTIVPCNITFYPIRIGANPLPRLAGLLHKELSPRLAEELLIEGNLLLKDTDMDVRLGEPVRPSEHWAFWERRLLGWAARRFTGWDELTSADVVPGWGGRLLTRRAKRRALEIRDRYMVGMYARVTVNLSHLASRLIFRLLDRDVLEMEDRLFHRALYLAVKNVQTRPEVHLHRSLVNPDAYAALLRGRCEGLRQFVETAAAMGLVRAEGGTYNFLPKLREEHGFDEIRLENLVAVYANEVEPLASVTRAVDEGLTASPGFDPRVLARHRFDDERRSYQWDWEAFRKPRHEPVNRAEGATESGEPFLFTPEKTGGRLAVLLVHGFTASPAEVRPFGERVAALGYPCLGIRLKGHGTSPWDLLDRSWEDWFASVRAGYEILAGLADRVCVIGFSAGGSLALRLAAEEPEGLTGVAAVCAPVTWRDRAMGLVTVIDGANRLAEVVSSGKGFMPFHHSAPEHPAINYLHKPVRALRELNLLVDDTVGHLDRVRCPVLLVQSTEDPVVAAESAEVLYRGLGTAAKSLVRIPSSRHGILYEDVGETWPRLLAFIETLEAP